MTVTTRVQPIDRDLIIRLTGQDPAARQAEFAAFARAKLAEADAQNSAAIGYVPEHKTFVDGSEGVEDNVKPDGGTILYEFQLIRTTIDWIEEQLLAHSPVLSGAYRRAHKLYADDIEVPFGAEVPPAQSYVFVNTAPYSRKIEGTGPKDRKPQSSQAPEGVFQAVASLARARFSNSVKISFAFVSEPSGAVGEWAQTSSARALAARVRGGNPTKHTEWLTRQPAIIVTPR